MTTNQSGKNKHLTNLFFCPHCNYKAWLMGEQHYKTEDADKLATFSCPCCQMLFVGLAEDLPEDFPDLYDLDFEDTDIPEEIRHRYWLTVCPRCEYLTRDHWSPNQPNCPKCQHGMKMWERTDIPVAAELPTKEAIERKIMAFYYRNPDYFRRSINRFFNASAIPDTNHEEATVLDETKKSQMLARLQQLVSAFDLTTDIPEELQRNKYEIQVCSFPVENGIPLIDDTFMKFYHSLMYRDMERNSYQKAFSSNTNFEWSVSFIEELYDDNLIDWPTLSTNPALPWNLEMIDHFVEMWWWGSPLMELDTNAKTYRKGLADNPGIPWTIDWLVRYEPFMDFDFLPDNRNIWDKVFKPFVNEKMVDVVSRSI